MRGIGSLSTSHHFVYSQDNFFFEEANLIRLTKTFDWTSSACGSTVSTTLINN
jgi:hypothetical protein